MFSWGIEIKHSGKMGQGKLKDFVLQYLKAITSILLLKVKNRDARKRCEICSKLTIKTPEQRYWRRSGVFIGNFEYISQVLLVLLLLNLNI